MIFMDKLEKRIKKYHRILEKIAKLESMARLLDLEISSLEKRLGRNRYD